MSATYEQDVRAAVGCPRCGSPIGRACRTPSGSSAPAHRERRDAWIRERARRESERRAEARAAEEFSAARRKAEAPKGRPTPQGERRRLRVAAFERERGERYMRRLQRQRDAALEAAMEPRP